MQQQIARETLAISLHLPLIMLQQHDYQPTGSAVGYG